MTDGKFMILGVTAILFIGVLSSILLDPFVDIQEETEDKWIEKVGVVEVTGYTIDIFKYVVSTPIWIGESVFNIFSFESDNPRIVISDTGEHDTDSIAGNISLDGKYNYRSNYNPDGADEVYENTIWVTILSWDTAEIRVNKTDDEVDKAWLVLDSQGNDYENRIYEPVDYDQWYEEWELVNDSYDWNEIARGEGERFEIDTPDSASEGVINFFDKVKEQLQDSVRVFGLFPDWIGIPVFIIIVLGIMITIIKLLPF